MSYSEKYLFQKLNTDDADNVLQKGMFRELENGRIGVTANNTRFLVENIKGNLAVNTYLPEGTNKEIGSKYVKQIDTIFYFLYNSLGNHRILKMQVTPTYGHLIAKVLEWSGLNFQEDGYITQIDYVNGDLYWTAKVNEPRFINVAKALNGDYSDPKEEDLTVIRRPPMYPLGASRQTDAGRTDNNIANHAFQFAYRYVYEGNKYSVLSIYSKLVNYAITADASKNYLTISIPDEETQPFGLKKTQLLYRYGNAGAWYIWKDVTDGSLAHDFYNDTLGILEPNIDERQLFDDVPRLAEAQAFIKNRLIYGNYLKGFNLPSSIGLTASVAARAATTSVNERVVKFIQIHKITQVVTTLGYWYKLNGVGLYYEASYDSGTDTVTSLGTAGKTYLEVEDYYNADHGTYYYQMPVLGYYTFDVTTDTNDPYMKKGGEYQIAVLFTDFAGRNTGVITADGAKAYLTDDPTDTDKYVIGWDLSTATVDEIPDWATHYYLARTNNLSKSFYLQGHTSDIWYRAGNDTFYKTRLNAEHLYLDVSCLSKNGTGYTFTEGDQIKVWSLLGGDYDFKIIKQEGQFVVVENPGLGELTEGHVCLFEIYRPGLKDQEQRFFEVGEAFEILNPGTANRELSIKTGTMNGDTFDASRSKWSTTGSYSTTDPYANEFVENAASDYEAMNPKDEHYDEWLTDAGRVSLVIDNPEEKRSTTVPCYSGELLPDSNWNELHKFVPANRYDKISETVTPIVAFTVINEHLLAHHERNTTSFLVGEGVMHYIGGQLVVKTSGVIGHHDVLLGSHGCVPTTIEVGEDRVWWLDAEQGYVVRYTANGVMPITNGEFGIERKIKGYCELIRRGMMDMPKSGYDPDTKEYYLQFPEYETLIFSEENGGWGGSVVFKSSLGVEPEGFAHNAHTMYSFMNGAMWRHSGNLLFNHFYGVQQKRKLHFVMNVEASKNKVWENIWIEADQLADDELMNVVEFSNPDGQFTYLKKGDFDLDEGDWKAAIPFDENTANMTPEEAMKGGDRMRSKTLDVVIYSDINDVNALRLVTGIFGISPYTL